MHEPAERLEDGPATEDAGIAVENPAAPPPAVNPGERCRRPAVTLVSYIEISADDRWISHRRADPAHGRTVKTGIGVEK